MIEWRDVFDNPGYQVSEEGQVRSSPRIVTQPCRWGGMIQRTFEGKILKPGKNTKGYLHVSLGKGNTQLVAKLVAQVFIGPCPDGAEVNHKDGDKNNNSVGNLEYVTSTENNHHALRTGLRRMKVQDSEIPKLREMAKMMSLREVGRRTGIHHSYVRYLIDGKRICNGPNHEVPTR